MLFTIVKHLNSLLINRKINLDLIFLIIKFGYILFKNLYESYLLSIWFNIYWDGKFDEVCSM